MAILFTNISAFFGLLLAIFKDYLKVNKMWPRKQKRAVADSISITASLIGLANSIPYLLLVLFVYHDWLVSVRTISNLFREILTLLIGIGFWLPINRGRPFAQLFFSSVKGGKGKEHLEVVIVPQNEDQIRLMQETHPELMLVSRQGGQVFVVSACQSRKKAESIGSPLREEGFYVTHIPFDGGQE